MASAAPRAERRQKVEIATGKLAVDRMLGGGGIIPPLSIGASEPEKRMSNAAKFKATLDVVGTVAVIVAAGAVVWTLVIKDDARAPVATSQVETVEGLSLSPERVINVLGHGRLAIVEFSDFQCPFCSKHVSETLPVLKQALIDTGTVSYVALHYPFETIHPLALQASQAAECAAQQGQFWEMHKALLDKSVAQTHEDLVHRAFGLGLDQPRFIRCMALGETLKKIRGDQAEGRRLGVRGTPVFFVGRIRSDRSIELVRRINGVVPPDVFMRAVTSVGNLPDPG